MKYLSDIINKSFVRFLVRARESVLLWIKCDLKAYTKTALSCLNRNGTVACPSTILNYLLIILPNCKIVIKPKTILRSKKKLIKVDPAKFSWLCVIRTLVKSLLRLSGDPSLIINRTVAECLLVLNK